MSTEKDLSPLFKGYYEILQENVQDYDGKLKEIIKLTPTIFKLFTNLLEDPLVTRKSKPIINATIAYFVAPFDAIPEEIYGPIGYLDDLFLCAWSIKKLEGQLGYAILENNWEGDMELKRVIDEVSKETEEVVKDKEQTILEYVGLI